MEELAPEAEGAPKTLREMENYILSFVGCVNISVEDSNSPYFAREADSSGLKKNVINFKTSGEDFVMNVDKVDLSVLRRDIRRTYPNYQSPEWSENKLTWPNPRDTVSVPTGMFMRDVNCYDKPVTISTTFLKNYGEVAPHRKNPSFIR